METRAVFEAGTGAVRSADLADERWDLISWDAARQLLLVSNFDSYDLNPVELVNEAVTGLGQFLGHSGPEDRLDGLAEAWWKLAAAIQIRDGNKQFIPALMKRVTKTGSERHYPFYALTRLATTCNEGAIKYAEENWHHGFQIKSLANHGLKHLVKWTNGDDSEDHLGHTMWSFMAATHVYLFRQADMCEFLLGRNYTITPELQVMHDRHASRYNAHKSKGSAT